MADKVTLRIQPLFPVQEISRLASHRTLPPDPGQPRQGVALPITVIYDHLSGRPDAFIELGFKPDGNFPEPLSPEPWDAIRRQFELPPIENQDPAHPFSGWAQNRVRPFHDRSWSQGIGPAPTDTGARLGGLRAAGGLVSGRAWLRPWRHRRLLHRGARGCCDLRRNLWRFVSRSELGRHPRSACSPPHDGCVRPSGTEQLCDRLRRPDRDRAFLRHPKSRGRSGRADSPPATKHCLCRSTNVDAATCAAKAVHEVIDWDRARISTHDSPCQSFRPGFLEDFTGTASDARMLALYAGVLRLRRL